MICAIDDQDIEPPSLGNQNEIMKWNEKLNWQFYKEDLSFNEGIEAQNFTVSP